MAGQIIRTPGCDIHVLVEGKGFATLFVHGFGGDLHGWDALCARRPAGRQYIRPDLRGFGRSVARSGHPFHHADDLAALLDALHIECCDLVGLSMGGAVSIRLALEHPERVRSLALLSTGLAGWDWSEEWRILWRPIAAAAREGDMILAKALWRDHPMFESLRGTPAFPAFEAEMARFSGREWVEDRQAQVPSDLERLHRLSMPILLLTGGRDTADLRVIADLIAATAPDVRRHVRSDLGHMLHLEDPDWCHDRLTEFRMGL